MREKITKTKYSANIVGSEGISARIYEHGSMVAHEHEFVELVCIVAGSGVHAVGDERLPISAGDVILIDSGVKHSYEVADGEKLTLCNCLFWPGFLTSAITGEKFIAAAYDALLSSGDGERIDSGYVAVSGAVSEEISGIILKIMHEQKRREPGHIEIMRSLLTVALIKLFRYCTENNQGRKDSGEKHKLIQEVIDYIAANDGRELSVVSVSKQAFVSPAYLSRVFKECTGKSIVSYIQSKRLSAAAKLLLETDKPVESVIEKIGYSDKKHFYELFFKAYGTTPGEYRASKKSSDKTEK